MLLGLLYLLTVLACRRRMRAGKASSWGRFSVGQPGHLTVVDFFCFLLFYTPFGGLFPHSLIMSVLSARGSTILATRVDLWAGLIVEYHPLGDSDWWTHALIRVLPWYTDIGREKHFFRLAGVSNHWGVSSHWGASDHLSQPLWRSHTAGENEKNWLRDDERVIPDMIWALYSD